MRTLCACSASESTWAPQGKTSSRWSLCGATPLKWSSGRPSPHHPFGRGNIPRHANRANNSDDSQGSQTRGVGLHGAVRISFLRLTRQGTTDNGPRAPSRPYGRLKKLGCVPPTISTVQHHLVKAIPQNHPRVGPGELQGGHPEFFAFMVGAATGSCDKEFVPS